MITRPLPATAKRLTSVSSRGKCSSLSTPPASAVSRLSSRDLRLSMKNTATAVSSA